ncbi:MAG: hypothetical protein MJE77_18010 [Proteobacteria bacterium]|nr:hypothetical protein [Pseudomonadota bacterium]
MIQHPSACPKDKEEPIPSPFYRIYTNSPNSYSVPFSLGRDRDLVDALVQDNGIDVQVEWNGESGNLGRFEVRVAPGSTPDSWQPCTYLAQNDDDMDVMSPKEDIDGEVLTLRVRRGPEHPEHSFGIKLIPIVWKSGFTLPTDPEAVVVRGEHYEYEDGWDPEQVEWSMSIPGGTGEIEKSLDVGRSYALFVRLQSPSAPGNWLVQDPIVRTSSRGGTL